MEVNRFTRTKYFKWMVSREVEIRIELAAFNSEFKDLSSVESTHLNAVLKNHLIIEHYIDRYLEAAFPEIELWGEMRLRFSTKTKMLSNKRTTLSMVLPGIEALNRVRNKYAHNLHYVPSPSDYVEITEFITMWRSAAGQSVPVKLEDVLAQFTITSCGLFNDYIVGIQKHTPGRGLN